MPDSEWEQGAISRPDYEEHGHVGGAETNPAFKRVFITGASSLPTLYAVVNTGAPGGNLGDGAIVDGTDALIRASVMSTPSGYPQLVKLLDLDKISVTVNPSTALTSLASGTEVRSLATVMNFPAAYPVTNLVSMASINGKVDVGSITNLASLASIYGTVQVSNATILISAPTLYAVVNTSAGGLTSLASGTEVRSLATILNFPASQAVTGTFWQATQPVSGTVAATQSGNWDIRSVLSLASIYGQVGITGTVPVSGTFYQATQPVSGTFWQATQPISGSVGLTGLISLASGTTVLTNPSGVVSLASGTEVRSLATILNFPATQPVSFGLMSLASGQEIRSLATILNFPTTQVVSFNQLVSLASGTSVLTSFTGLISLASGTEVRSLATILNFPAGFNVNNTPAVTQSGTWTVQPGNTANTTAWKVDGSAVTQPISGNVGITGLISLASGTSVLASFSGLISLASGTQIITSTNNLTSLASGTEVKSLATILNFPASYPVTNLVSVASINGKVDVGTITNLASIASIYGNVGLAGGTNFIGLASVVPSYQGITANYTSFATVMSASGAASLFAPPSSQRFIIKDLIIGSLGTNEVNIQSGGSTVLVPYIALATMGGYISNFGESGLRGKALDDAFIINKNSTATLSVFVTVRFDTT